MKTIIKTIACGGLLLVSEILSSQNVAINASGASPNASAMLDIASGSSFNKGLLIPRVTAAQKAAMNPLPAVAQGLMVYQTDGLEGIYYNTSLTTTPLWSFLTAGGWSLTGNAGTVAGTDLRYIQEILGHSSSKTTEVYTHVSTKSIQNVKSPFDDL